ncbi:MAG: S8 family serine peptidase [Polaribacter sp.]
MQAQEKMTIQLNGSTIEFNISQDEIYVEFAENQKSTVRRISKDGFEEISSKSAILKMSELTGTFNKRKQSFRGKTSQNFQRIEPVLIYNDGTKQISKGELNIKLKANALVEDLLKGRTFTVQPNEFEKNLYLVKLNLETSELFELVNQLQKDNRVEFAEPNFIRMMKPHTNDPFFSSQWAINNQGYLGGTIDADMDVDDAWNYTTGSGIKVAVIDEGVDLSHTDLTANLLTGYDATGNGSNGAPNEENDDAHGTACAGIIAAVANNTNGTAGVAYNAKIIPVRIAYSVSSTSTAWITNDNWIANGINWAWQNGADVLSNSYGGGSYSSTIESAINNAVNNGRNGKGSVVLFSSGNDSGGNGNPVSFPATVASAISVGASSMCDTRKNLSSCDGEFWGSNFGNSLDIVAPGVQIYTTDISGSNGYRNGDYMPSFNGTSSACPNAAGVVALILSADQSLTQQEAREILERNTDKVNGYNYSNNLNQPNGTWNNEMGYGRVNAFAAVQAAQQFNQAELEDIDILCYNDSNTIQLNNNQNNPVTWQVSSNVVILSSDNSSVTVSASSSNSTGNGWVKATLSNGITLQEDFNVGTPSSNNLRVITTGNGIYVFSRTWQELYAFGGDDIEWSFSTSVMTRNSGPNSILIYPTSSTGSITVGIRARNECGYSQWKYKHFTIYQTTEDGGIDIMH